VDNRHVGRGKSEKLRAARKRKKERLGRGPFAGESQGRRKRQFTDRDSKTLRDESKRDGHWLSNGGKQKNRLQTTKGSKVAKTRYSISTNNQKGGERLVEVQRNGSKWHDVFLGGKEWKGGV